MDSGFLAHKNSLFCIPKTRPWFIAHHLVSNLEIMACQSLQIIRNTIPTHPFLGPIIVFSHPCHQGWEQALPLATMIRYPPEN